MGLILDLPQPQPTIAPPPRPTNARFWSDYRVEQLRAIQEKIATMIEAKARNIDLEPEVDAEPAAAPEAAPQGGFGHHWPSPLRVSGVGVGEAAEQ